ncbi:hypothetical protein [Massilia varians]|uniref:hypothetical protein n=1 Tax=Massilia varians TaxID=457921 RepID=UPI0024901993|nr:hypothetical protein [Massilia varians]
MLFINKAQNQKGRGQRGRRRQRIGAMQKSASRRACRPPVEALDEANEKRGDRRAGGRRFSDPGILPDSALESPVLRLARGRKAGFC